MPDLTLPEPTAEQCTANARMDVGPCSRATAAWYPQMGGFVGKCWIVTDADAREDSCVDVHIWHDGEFPFTGEAGRRPVVLHHCLSEQFREFADAMDRAIGGDGG